MDTLKENIRLCIALFIFLVLLVSVFFLHANPVSFGFDEHILVPYFDEYVDTSLTIKFSETDHFFTDDVIIEIVASNPNARVFYSIDGSTPTIYSAEYTDPLRFGLKPEMYVVVLRAMAVYNYLASNPITHTFFIGYDVHDRFGTLVFSLSTNPDYLFDHDIGIMIDGRVMDEFIYENPGRNPRSAQATNFWMRGREWERPINVEVFTSYGDRVLAQSAGVRMHGSSSRVNPQKSFRIMARRYYSPDTGRFHFDFFPNETVYNGIPLTHSNTLILRNGGSNYWVCRLSNELGSALARNFGFRVVTPFEAAAVFLNGEYYGFMWLQVRVDEHYLEDIFNAPTREFDVVTGLLNRHSIPITYDERILVDLILKEEFATKNLIDDDVFAQLEEIVDVDNLLLYYAFQIYVDNIDWPGIGWGHNLRRWRYTGEQTPCLPPELDGRWRYAMFDFDSTFGLNTFPGFGFPTPPEGMIFQQVLEGVSLFRPYENHRDLLLANILSRQDMADKFTMILCDIAANIVTPEIMSDTIDAIITDAVWREIAFSAERWGMCLITFEYEHERIRNFANSRHKHIFRSLADFFGFPMDMYTVSIIGGEAIIGTQQGTFSRYFNHLVVPVSPVLPPFTEFSHWMLNGERIYNANISVSLTDAIDGYVTLELITRADIPPLIIADVQVTETGNGSVLLNPHYTSVSTTGLFLSNDPNHLHLWRLPAATIPPGRMLELAGRDTMDFAHRFRIQKNFNVRENSMLILSDETGRILDTFVLRSSQEPRDIAEYLP